MAILMAYDGVDEQEISIIEETIYGDCIPSRKKPRICNNSLMENSDSQDRISRLPDECIVEIFRFLESNKDRCSCAAVSKKWLVLQAEMLNSAFKSDLSSPPEAQTSPTSRCLEGSQANDTTLAAIVVAMCPLGGLTELCIRNSFPSKGVTDLGLKIIAKACPSLKLLTVWDCLEVGNDGLISIARGCSRLMNLDLLNLPFIGDEALISIAENCPDLSTMILDSCPQISDATLQALARYSSKLELISLINCPLLNADGIASLISKLLKLEKLRFVSLNVRDNILQAVGRHGTSVRTLCLDNISRISELGLGSIGGLEKVEFLSLKSCRGLKETCFKVIGTEFIGLKSISIENGTALSDEGLKELAESAPLLESLRLVYCNNVTSKGLREVFLNCHRRLKLLCLVQCSGLNEVQYPSSSISSPLPRCPLLQTLKLHDCAGIGDSFLWLLGCVCERVRDLELIGLSSITDGGVLTLLKALDIREKALFTVNLSGCLLVSDWTVLAISSAFGEKLISLKLAGCERVSDRSLEMIARLCPTLVDLDLSRCGISDAGVLALARSRLQNIKMLSLAGCMGITDKSLLGIELMCGNLIALNIKGCRRLSKKEVDSVREILWWCDVMY